MQGTELTNKTVNSVDVDGTNLKITFNEKVNLSKITDVESFINKYFQFQLTRVARDGGSVIRFDTVNPAGKTEATDLTTEEVTTMLEKTKTDDASDSNSGWGTEVDWSAFTLEAGEGNTVIIKMTGSFIQAADLVDTTKINSGNALIADKGYKISFYKKGDTSTRYKMQFNTTEVDGGYTPTTIKFIQG